MTRNTEQSIQNINPPNIVQTTHSRGHKYPGSRGSLAIQK